MSGPSDEPAQSGETEEQVGTAKEWKPSSGKLTKLEPKIARKLTVSGVAAKALAIKYCDDEKFLVESRIRAITDPGRAGLREKSFLETVGALAELYPDRFAGKTYGDVAENESALEHVANTLILKGLDPQVESESEVTNEEPETASADTEPVPEEQSQNQISLKVFVGGCLLASAVTAVIVGWIATSTPDSGSDRKTLSQWVIEADSSIFYGSKDGRYDIGRINANKSAEYSETDFVREISEAKSSFDILANNAGFVREIMFAPMEKGIRRGVNYRIVLSDYRNSNEWLSVFRDAIGDEFQGSHIEASRDIHIKIREFVDRINSDKANNPNSEFTGSVEVRWNSLFLFNTMWIRDSGQENAVGHLGIHFHRGKPTWPSIRVSRKIAPDVVTSIEREFRYIFEHASAFDAIEVPTDE